MLVKSDAFSFGLSILEMGNLLSLKDKRLNKEKTLLTKELTIFQANYPQVAKIIKPLLDWNEI